jgi:glycosyltransferase involved in cell wall biosynthesis
MGKGLKVALIDPVGGHGGMDYYDYGLSRGLGLNDVEVHYFTCNETLPANIEGVHTHYYFSNLWDRKGVIKLFILLRGYFKAFQFAKTNHIRTLHFQFFHLGFQNVISLWFAYLFKLRRIVTLHDVEYFKSKKMKWMRDLGIRLSSKIIVHNNFSLQQLRSKSVIEDLIHVIPHGNYLPFIDFIPYQPQIKKPLRLLFFGQIKEVKGLDILLRAIAGFKTEEVLLTIAGRPWGTSVKYYNALIDELNIQNKVTTHFGYIPNDKVYKYFEECDVVVLPYRKIYQSGVLLLAMSYGRATLCSDLEPFKEIIHDDNT